MKYLRKTHWTKDIKPELNGQEVILAGWVWEIRDLGKIKFIILRDREGFIQITAKKGVVSDEILKVIEDLGKEDVIVVKGIVKASKIAKKGVEVIPKEIQVLNKAKPLPIDIWGSVETDLPTRLKFRAIDLKRPINLAIFKIESIVVKAIRDKFYEYKFIEVFTPKIIATCTEGGADLFTVQYFERIAYLAQSPQLYKEQLTASLERVFEIAPAYRAEKHDTNYHLNEFISIDAEAAFMDYFDVMNILDELIVNAYEYVRKYCQNELAILNLEIEVPKKPFKKITYDEVIDLLKKRGVEVRKGDDIPTAGLKVLSEEIGEPFYIIDWPFEIRPFYTKAKEDIRNCKDLTNCVTESFDLIIDGIEISSGSTRIHNRDELEYSMKLKGLNPENFTEHLQVFDYGMPPHAGFGLGLYRLLMVMLKRKDIREVCLYPRDRYRLTP